ncbi:Bacteriophage HK97-gp10, putative tail-component [Cohnella sp. OV330]|uniref:HK97 gp10 family phage protein n=1 Tax=Cohnella sp. OV330 TaxID=1855288 RepID=UPI0008F38176|nr:HK97 gp10 family phage protein [Cohnella sp. OV330]SFB62600.1 Bacteriophage HK97-gp10, putative tail-component [Cohnella sp. OV330]
MPDFEIDDREIDVFSRELAKLQQHYPKEARQIMLRSGTKARAIISRKAKQLVHKVTGNYLRSIKRGKVWIDEGAGWYKVRVYTRSPHGHLIEYGHRIVDKAGNEHGFARGYHVFDKAANEIADQWDEILEREFDRIMDKL